MKRRAILVVLLIATALAAAWFHFAPSFTSLAPALISSDDFRRNAALMHLEKLAPEKKAALADELVRETTNADWQKRLYALYALRKIGTAPEKTGPAALKCLDDENSRVRQEALITLTEMGPGALNDFFRVLPQSTGRVQESLVRIIAGMGPAAAPKTLAYLKSENPLGRALGAKILAQMSSAPPEAAPALLPLLKDADQSVRKQAAISLNIIDRSNAATVPAHIETINRASWDADSAAAANALAALGPKAKAAVPALTARLKNAADHLTDKNAARPALANALNRIDPRQNGLTGYLWDLKQKDPLTRYRGAYAISEMTPPNIGALDALLIAMDDKDIYVRARANAAAARIGFDKSERLKPQLVKKATDSLRLISDEQVGGYAAALQEALAIKPPQKSEEEEAETLEHAPSANIP